MPQANGHALALWNETQIKGLRLPDVAKRFLEAGMVNARRGIVFNATPLILTKSDIGVSLPSRYRITFTPRIETVDKDKV